jgi:hypothetical protein
MGKLYTSMRGKQIDMEQLNLKHEQIPAVGNMKVNARGDQLGPGGQIVKTKEEILADYYRNNPRAPQEEATSTRKKG